ncbi:hypothetical protein [Glutamicibacter nicotianae]|uniref:hypothetical protein n=1 Tax=Glutamicibacter nicotianae TaxID=37929 RepID=UPI000EF8C0E3|nr:hypothetical protein [Glutamicibacter nicotianae]
MPDTPLNPDARRAAFEAVQAIDGPASIGSMELVDVAVSAYLAVAQPVAQKLTDTEWQEFQAIPDQGYSHRAWVDARLAERVAVAQPEVNSVEELVTTRTGLALANQAFKEGLRAGIRACNASGPDKPFTKPESPYSAPLLAMIKADRPEVDDA